MPRKKKLEQNPNHPVADGRFAGGVAVWYEQDDGTLKLDYIVGPFTTDRGAYEWAENNRAQGRTCTIELLIPPLVVGDNHLNPKEKA